MSMHATIIRVFDACFAKQFNTCLVGGAKEPIYLPADATHRHHRIIFTQDYAASALHEIAHWCVAGPERREQVDYGYWYAPDGRTETQQREFERVEVKPQAMEWIFSVAANIRFRLSSDNLAAGLGASDAFAYNVAQQARIFCTQGLNSRARCFSQALARECHVADPFDPKFYQYQYLQ